MKRSNTTKLGCVIVFMFIGFLFLYKLGMFSGSDLPPGYRENYVGDEKEIFSTRDNAGIPPNVIYQDFDDSFLVAVSSDPKRILPSPRKSRYAGSCTIYLIDLKTGRQTQFSTVENLATNRLHQAGPLVTPLSKYFAANCVK